jgi:xylan 1,4-beta-xylosidase
MITRRRFVSDAAAFYAGLSLASTPPLALAAGAPGDRSLSLGWLAQPGATYTNPIIPGDHPDASPIRVGDDFYLTHSSFDYAPGPLIWHSRDLVNWRPVTAALTHYHGGVWAPYLCEYQGRFYIYFPADQKLHVVHADKPTGPWSEPIDLAIAAIAPGHIAENGRRFLYMAGGRMAELNPDCLSVKTPPRKVFDPWPVPATTRMECTCLEAPKLLERSGWFYLIVAEGGTAGPATSHSVVAARSRHAEGPWEWAPHNPIVHTASRDDRWLSVGHGRLVDTPDGRWYMTVHSYENGYRALGRQLLPLPIEWMPDGWFRVPPGTRTDAPLPMPIPGTHQQPALDPSDNFISSELGLQWAFWQEFDPARFTTGNGALILQARGDSLANTSVLTTPVGGHAYTVEVDVEAAPGCATGLLLFYSPEHSTGIQLDDEGIGVRLANGYVPSRVHKGATRATLRVVNDDQEVDFYYRVPGEPWRRAEESAEIAGMNHNVLGGFLDVRPAVFATGTGQATLRGFRYWPTVNVPS